MGCEHKQEGAYQRLSVIGEQRLGLLVRDGRVNDNIVTLIPVDRGGDLVLVTKLERIDHSDDLVKRTAGLGRVGDGEADDFLGVDYEDGSKRSSKIQVGSMIGVSLTGQ